MRPSNMTRMRSASARISSSSTETSRIALPASRISIRRRWMNSMAPMSTPRVGWPTSSRSGSCSISRASTIFCWLPPEKAAVRRAGLRGRTSNAASPLAAVDDLAAVQQDAAPLQVGIVLVAEDRVLVGGEAADQAHALAVLGHVGDAPAAQHARQRAAVVGRHGLAVDQHLRRRAAACRPAPPAARTGRCRRRRRCRRSRRRARRS